MKLYQVLTKDNELPIMQNERLEVIAYELATTTKKIKSFIKNKNLRFGRYYITSIEIDESEMNSETD